MGNVDSERSLDFYMKYPDSGGTWLAQSVERLASAQVTILWFVSSSPESGSLSAQWLLLILLPPDSLCPSPACALSLSLSLSLSLKHTHTNI